MSHGRVLTAATRVLSGVGLHSGRWSSARVLPAAPGAGLVFCRGDGAGATRTLPAQLRHAVCTARHTVLCDGDFVVETPEHLLAALAGLGIWDARVVLEGGQEVPALDGSAQPWVWELLRVSRPAPRGPGTRLRVLRPFGRQVGQSSCTLLPCPHAELSCGVLFDHPAIGRQRVRWLPGDEAGFVHRIAPARTFGLLSDRPQLQRARLARGASLSTALIYGPRGALNPEGTRFLDEVARHKTLDIIGDLSLLSGPLLGRVSLWRASHRLLQSTLREAVAARAVGSAVD